VPVGTTREIGKLIEETTGKKAGLYYFLCYAPERTIEGNAIEEISNLPQLLSGVTAECERVGSHFFSEFVRSVVLCESLEACEFGKLISNAYRDSIFAFANEVALISAGYGIDVNSLIREVNLGYSRNAIPMPSPGVGGPCLSKDSYLISNKGETSVIRTARKLNENMPFFVANRILEINNKFPGPILILGVAFKGVPETKDVRSSPSVELYDLLRKSSLDVSTLDAVIANDELKSLRLNAFEFDGQSFAVLVIMNNHPRNAEIARNLIEAQQNANPLVRIAVFDPWNVLSIAEEKRFNISRFTLSTAISE
jgi:nucleotide sugar dehydrogenase